MPSSLASLETTLPPTPLKKLLAADGASVYVFSHDETLVGTVQDAGGEQYPVYATSEWLELEAAIDRGLCHIVLLDADALDDLQDRIAELRGLEPRLVILLAAPRDTAQQIIGMLSDRSVHRLLIKPAATGITRLLLESAVSRYLQLREDSAQTLEAEIESLKRRQPERETTRWPAWLLATALVSLLLGAVIVGGVVRLRPPAAAPVTPAPVETGSEEVAPAPVAGSELASTTSTSAAADGAADTRAAAPATNDADTAENIPNAAETAANTQNVAAPPPEPFAALLARGRLAFVEGRLAEPVGDSALDHFAAIVAQDPEHAEANARLADVLEALFTRAEAALLAGELDLAATTIDHIRRIRPGGTGRLAFLEAQLERLLEAGDAAAPLAADASASGTEGNAGLEVSHTPPGRRDLGYQRGG